MKSAYTKRPDSAKSKWLLSERTSSAAGPRAAFCSDSLRVGRRLYVEESSGSRNQSTQRESGHIARREVGLHTLEPRGNNCAHETMLVGSLGSHWSRIGREPDKSAGIGSAKTAAVCGRSRPSVHQRSGGDVHERGRSRHWPDEWESTKSIPGKHSCPARAGGRSITKRTYRSYLVKLLQYGPRVQGPGKRPASGVRQRRCNRRQRSLQRPTNGKPMATVEPRSDLRPS